jgi:hypothetical protein
LQLSEQQVGQVFSQRPHQRLHQSRNLHQRQSRNQHQSRNLHQRLSRNQHQHPRR